MIRGELAILSGNAHPALAQSVATELGVELLDGIIGHFPDEESRIQIQSDVRDRDVFLIQPTGTPANQHIMEALLTVDALCRASADRVTAVLPYFGYARQDRKEASRVPISAEAVMRMFDVMKTDRYLTFDPHAPQIQGFTANPFDILPLTGVLVDTVVEETDEPVIVAPDIGAIKRAKAFAYLMKTDWAAYDKHRKSPTDTEIVAMIGTSVVGRNALLVDDVISTAGTVLQAAVSLKKAGAKQVDIAASHGVFAGDALERINATDEVGRVFVSDTLPARGNSSKIHRISIAKFLAEAIDNIHNGYSVSGMIPKIP